MKTIWKYPLGVMGPQEKQLPRGASVLTAGIDPRGGICIWAEVDNEEKELEVRRFVVYETGGPMMQRQGFHLHYLNTVVERNRPLVWHVYEERERFEIPFTRSEPLPLMPNPPDYGGE